MKILHVVTFCDNIAVWKQLICLLEIFLNHAKPIQDSFRYVTTLACGRNTPESVFLYWIILTFKLIM